MADSEEKRMMMSVYKSTAPMALVTMRRAHRFIIEKTPKIIAEKYKAPHESITLKEDNIAIGAERINKAYESFSKQAPAVPMATQQQRRKSLRRLATDELKKVEIKGNKKTLRVSILKTKLGKRLSHLPQPQCVLQTPRVKKMPACARRLSFGLKKLGPKDTKPTCHAITRENEPTPTFTPFVTSAKTKDQEGGAKLSKLAKAKLRSKPLNYSCQVNTLRRARKFVDTTTLTDEQFSAAVAAGLIQTVGSSKRTASALLHATPEKQRKRDALAEVCRKLRIY